MPNTLEGIARYSVTSTYSKMSVYSSHSIFILLQSHMFCTVEVITLACPIVASVANYIIFIIPDADMPCH